MSEVAGRLFQSASLATKVTWNVKEGLVISTYQLVAEMGDRKVIHFSCVFGLPIGRFHADVRGSTDVTFTLLHTACRMELSDSVRCIKVTYRMRQYDIRCNLPIGGERL